MCADFARADVSTNAAFRVGPATLSFELVYRSIKYIKKILKSVTRPPTPKSRETVPLPIITLFQKSSESPHKNQSLHGWRSNATP